MKAKMPMYNSNGFNKLPLPEDVFEELPVAKTMIRSICNPTKKLRLFQSTDKFWRQKEQSTSLLPRLDLSATLFTRMVAAKQFGEIQNEVQIKEDLKNIDRWVFDNLKKIRFFADEQKHQRNSVTIKNLINHDRNRFIPNLDLKFLDLILREEKAGLAKHTHESNRDQTDLNEKNAAIMQKVAVTAETINSEHNKTILLELLKKKVQMHDKYNNKDESFVQMLAKMILTDLISSFTVLKIFKHHNIFHIKNLLIESKQALQVSASAIIEDPNITSKAQKEVNFKAFEKALFDNYNICIREIKVRKQRLNKLRDQINKKKLKLSQKQRQVTQLSDEIERRENPTDYKRKMGASVNPQEFIDLAELKSVHSKMEAECQKYSRKASAAITVSQEETDKLEKYVEDLKFKKTLFFMKLKEIYYNLLADEESLLRQDKTVVSVVKLLWLIKAEVKEECFSKFYEFEHIAFLFKYTKLHNEFLELRKQNNIEKKVIKEQLIGVYQNIVDEKESQRISDIKKTIFCFKTSNLKILQKQKIKEAKSVVFQWEPVNMNEENRPRDDIRPTIDYSTTSRGKRGGMQVGSHSTRLTNVSENLCLLKENFIKAAVERVSINGKVHFVGSNSVWLKKLFTVFFGKKEAQFLINELMKMKNIKIKEITI